MAASRFWLNQETVVEAYPFFASSPSQMLPLLKLRSCIDLAHNSHRPKQLRQEFSCRCNAPRSDLKYDPLDDENDVDLWQQDSRDDLIPESPVIFRGDRAVEKAEKPEDPRRRRSRYHVVLVDDEEAILSAVGSFLSESGYQVTTFADAEMALPLLFREHVDKTSLWTQQGEQRSQSKASLDNRQLLLPRGQKRRRRRVDVIISDVRMPDGMDGLEFLTRIRGHRRTVALPVVLLTAKGQVEDRIEGYNAGADAYIPKPFDPEELVTVVDSLIAKQQQMLLLRTTTTSSDVENEMGDDDDDDNDDEDSDVLVTTTIAELQRDLGEIKRMLLEQGGGGTTVPGFVRATNAFFPPDEQEVLELICEGKSNREISQETFRSTRRVEQLITRMFRKAQVSNRTELVRWAIATGHVRL
ncbi:hypothetical protein ACA910_001689 [Epithemia clementina (nom. ined.)]